jgi:hypothetical protein
MNTFQVLITRGLPVDRPRIDCFSHAGSQVLQNAAIRFSDMANTKSICRSTAGNAPENIQE